MKRSSMPKGTKPMARKPMKRKAEWRGKRLDDRGLKFGATEFRTVRVVDAPIFTMEQRVAFAIFCVASVWDEVKYPAWHEWAAKWLAGEDRSANAANSANAGPEMLETAIAWALTLEPSR